MCAYCTFAENSIYFLTEPQRFYLKKFAEAAQRVVSHKVELAINLDELTDAAEWTYAEQQLQHRFICSTCNIATDVLGEYGSCPKCGKRNSGDVFHRKLNEIESLLITSGDNRRAELLGLIVSIFEAMANDLKKILTSIPSHPKRREQIRRINFQILRKQ